MNGQIVGYIRVSSAEQNDARQLDGHQLDRAFTDRISGKSTERPQLDALRAFVRDGDTVLVHSMDRLARNLDDLRRLVRELTGKGVHVQFLKEGLTFTGDDTPMATLLLSVMGAFAEFERAIIRERQAEGIALAKKRGVYRGRRPALSLSQARELAERAGRGESISALARHYGVSRQTCYAYLSGASSARPRHPRRLGSGDDRRPEHQ